MMQTFKAANEEELAEHIKEGRDYIEVEADLGNKVIKIKAVGYIGWGLVAAALIVAVVFVSRSPATSRTSGVVGFAAAAPAVATLGPAATITAVSLAVAGGGIGVLNKLRKYSLTKLPNGNVLLKK